jgi:hypothetical protein
MRQRLANHLRRSFGLPQFPEKAGVGIVPWLSGNGLRTRLLFNPMRDPSVRDRDLPAEVVRFAADGSVLDEWRLTIPASSVFPFDLPATERDALSCGYCWIRNLGGDRLLSPLQTHFQVSGPGTFAKTHGRAKGVVMFPQVGLADSIINALDPWPYHASTVQTQTIELRQGSLLLNVSNRAGRFRARYDDAIDQNFIIPAHGARLVWSTRPAALIVSFLGSAPFTFYIVMGRPDGMGLTLQHIQDAF